MHGMDLRNINSRFRDRTNGSLEKAIAYASSQFMPCEIVQKQSTEQGAQSHSGRYETIFRFKEPP